MAEMIVNPGAIEAINEQIGNLVKSIYPVGSVYMSFNSTLPTVISSIGAWEVITGGYVLKTVTSGTGGTLTAAGKTGETAITIAQMPSHNHNSKSLSGSFDMRLLNDGQHIPNNASGICSVSNGVGSSGDTASMNSSTRARDRVSINATHTHDSQGSGQAHTHDAGMPANVAVYMWKRTA